ncbi:hypothetical protein CTAYLR_003788 [Chrysophaeum taylorii]|uniref:Phospholipid/glycerol acyltransferase domain-containing protein n=1 Tax=Chrysophaeum taylorii TaxID=2483200 RepID=A0AAD7XNW6_9STRA|nr:hypothetical protein CTAYLR_003788 [Chrysophaeum taylorii]
MRTALACPPMLADYPRGSRVTTLCFYANMVTGFVLTWVSQLVVTYTIGLLMTKERRGRVCGYLVRIGCAGIVTSLTPGVRLRRSADSWIPPPEVVSGERAAIFVANHRSFMDPFALGAGLLPIEAKYVAKASIFTVPFGGWAMRRAGDLAIAFDASKGGWGTVKGSVGKMLAEASRVLEAGTSVGLFPEGTRMGYDLDKAMEAAGHVSKLMPFKPAFFDLAKKLKVPVVCVAMRGTDDVWPVGSNMIRPAEIVIKLAAPLDPDDFDTDKDLAEAARLLLGRTYQSLCKDD